MSLTKPFGFDVLVAVAVAFASRPFTHAIFVKLLLTFFNYNFLGLQRYGLKPRA